MKCDFNYDSCENEANFNVVFINGHVRHICKEHIKDRLEKNCTEVKVSKIDSTQ